MYSLPQASRITYEKLTKILKTGGYIRTGLTPGLLKHVTRPIQSSLTVNEFGVKYIGREYAIHIINHLQKNINLHSTGADPSYEEYNTPGTMRNILAPCT